MKHVPTDCGAYPVVAHWIDKYSPFFHNATEIHRVQRNDHLPDLVVLRETIEVVHGKHQRFRSELGVRQLPT